jgi:hypothetical protein
MFKTFKHALCVCVKAVNFSHISAENVLNIKRHCKAKYEFHVCKYYTVTKCWMIQVSKELRSQYKPLPFAL